MDDSYEFDRLKNESVYDFDKYQVQCQETQYFREPKSYLVQQFYYTSVLPVSEICEKSATTINFVHSYDIYGIKLPTTYQMTDRRMQRMKRIFALDSLFLFLGRRISSFYRIRYYCTISFRRNVLYLFIKNTL